MCQLYTTNSSTPHRCPALVRTFQQSKADMWSRQRPQLQLNMYRHYRHHNHSLRCWPALRRICQLRTDNTYLLNLRPEKSNISLLRMIHSLLAFDSPQTSSTCRPHTRGMSRQRLHQPRASICQPRNPHTSQKKWPLFPMKIFQRRSEHNRLQIDYR